jgi:hypothetical protein
MIQFLNETLGSVKRFFQARRTFSKCPVLFLWLLIADALPYFMARTEWSAGLGDG